ncbi:hypothetical protein [Actinomadura sp. 21ATH]|uniref:hypothetical protein n=1 Tax=Actinomadura sp. 21ATH TaxID=1735444 RepID=UPI0035C0FA9A
MDLAARTLAALYPNEELANHPAAITDDVLSLAPYMADYIKSGEYDRKSLLRHCPGGGSEAKAGLIRSRGFRPPVTVYETAVFSRTWPQGQSSYTWRTVTFYGVIRRGSAQAQ